MAEWLEKEVYSVEESSVEELQSCRCPHCGAKMEVKTDESNTP